MLSRLTTPGICRSASALLASQSRQLSFDLSETQKEVQAAALKFSKEVLVLNAAKFDESGEFPWEIIRQAHGLGLMNTQIPD